METKAPEVRILATDRHLARIAENGEGLYMLDYLRIRSHSGKTSITASDGRTAIRLRRDDAGGPVEDQTILVEAKPFRRVCKLHEKKNNSRRLSLTQSDDYAVLDATGVEGAYRYCLPRRPPPGKFPDIDKILDVADREEVSVDIDPVRLAQVLVAIASTLPGPLGYPPRVALRVPLDGASPVIIERSCGGADVTAAVMPLREE